MVGKGIIKDSHFRGWRDDSVIKHACCSEKTTTSCNSSSRGPLPLGPGMSTQSFTWTPHPIHITKHGSSQRTSHSSPATLRWQLSHLGQMAKAGLRSPVCKDKCKQGAAGETESKRQSDFGFNTLSFAHSVSSFPRSARI